MDSITKKIFTAAKQARGKAYAPYSKFRVGVAVETADGSIVSGCNVENASYGLCVCAERNALAAAIFQGHKKFKRIVVVSQNGCTPCGACRQVIWELCGDVPVICADPKGKAHKYTSHGLLPDGFGAGDLR